MQSSANISLTSFYDSMLADVTNNKYVFIWTCVQSSRKEKPGKKGFGKCSSFSPVMLKEEEEECLYQCSYYKLCFYVESLCLNLQDDQSPFVVLQHNNSNKQIHKYINTFYFVTVTIESNYVWNLSSVW